MSSPRDKAKGTKNREYALKEVLRKESKWDFSHITDRVTKSNTSGKSETDKHQAIWYRKQVGMITQEIPIEAICEVVAQELFRLYIPEQPKTRLTSDDDGMQYVLSKGAQGYIPLADFYSTDDESVVRDLRGFIEDGVMKGLGEIMVMSLWLNETDLRIMNLGVIDKGDDEIRMIKIDGDYCFSQMQGARGNAQMDISENATRLLPNPGDYESYNWLNIVEGGRCRPAYYDPGHSKCIVSFELSQNVFFRQEINRTILKILLTPENLLSEFVKHYVSDSNDITLMTDELARRKGQLEQAAFNDPDFTKYLNSSEARKDLAIFRNDLDKFVLTGKSKLPPVSYDDLKNELESLKDQSEIVSSPALSTTYLLANLSANLSKRQGPTAPLVSPASEKTDDSSEKTVVDSRRNTSSQASGKTDHSLNEREIESLSNRRRR